jgi:hypothetical protein
MSRRRGASSSSSSSASSTSSQAVVGATSSSSLGPLSTLESDSGSGLSQQSIWDSIFDDADNEYGEDEEANV